MKFSMEDIKSIGWMRCVGQKPRKVAEKKLHIDSPTTSPSAMALLEGTPTSYLEETLATTGMEVVEIFSPSSLASALAPPVSLARPQNLPALPALSPVVEASLPNSPPPAKVSSLRGASSRDDDILELRVRMH